MSPDNCMNLIRRITVSKITPYVGIKGTFDLKDPWVSNPGEQYEIVAVRNLSELARTGIDPKKSIYAAMGLIDGSGSFSWEAEERSNPFILTLKGSAGNVITIPDTYINSYPDTSVILYQRAIIAVDMGIFPEDEDLTSIANDLAELAALRTGMPASSKVHRIPLKDQPTVEQHNAYEKVRKYNKPESISNTEEVLSLRLEKESLIRINHSLKTRLESLGVIP